MKNKKIVVIGGTGLIGSKLVARLNNEGYEAVSASPDSGVNTITGEGLAEVLRGAKVVVDVSNSPSFDEEPATKFFETSTSNLLKAEKAADVGHHIALSVVGTEKLAEGDGIGGYFRAKLAQERLIKASPIPYSIVHATQFFEFIKSIADSGTEGDTVRVSADSIQPMAADDVAAAIAKVAVELPLNATVEVAGPEIFQLDQLVRQSLGARNDRRTVITDPNAGYFGAKIAKTTLIPAADALLGTTHFSDWMKGSTPHPKENAATGAK